MAEYQAANAPDQTYVIDRDQSNYQGTIVQVLRSPKWTARESNMGLLEIYQFEAHTREPTRDLKGGACGLHLESGSRSFPALPSPVDFSSTCQCQCSCTPSPCCPPPCPPCYPARPVESCLPGLHQKYRGFYPDCTENHLPKCYRNVVEHDDLYLPPSRPPSSASNHCNRLTPSRSWSPPSPPSQQKCNCGASQVRSGSAWDVHIPESKPCFQTFFHAFSRGSPPTQPDRSESTPLQMSPKQPTSRSTSPMQPYVKSCLSPRRSGVKNLINKSSQCSPRIGTDSATKSFQTQKSGVSSPLSPYNPEPPGLPDSQPRLPLAAELVTLEKHVQCNCSPRLEPAEYEEPYTRRPVSLDTDASIRRILRPESTLRSAWLECTCHQNPTSYKQLHHPTQHGSRSQSPSQSSTSTAQHRSAEADLYITTFLNDVKRILTSDVPPRLSPTHLNHDLKEDYYSELRSTFKPDLPSKEYSSGERIQESFSSMEFFSRVRSTLKPALPSVDFSFTDRWQDFPSRDNVASHGRQDWKQEFPSRKARIGSRLEATDWKQELPSNGTRVDRKQSWDYPAHPDWEYSSSLRATDGRQEYSSCVTTIERASSPITLITESGPSCGAERERPETAPTLTNSEAPRTSKRLRSGNGLFEAMKISSTRTLQANISESEEDYRYGPVQAAESNHLAKPSFNKQDTSSWLTHREVMHRCCCGTCQSTYSRSHFTTKCPFCANVHSCCCGMCSCPFPSCTSKSPIPDSSNCTSTTSSSGNDNLHKLHPHSNPSFLSRPKSLSPMRTTYLAGLALPEKCRPRSKSTRSKERDFEPSPRMLLESFHRYLKWESRRAKTSTNQQRRCPERRPAHWNPPSLYPDRSCSQQTKRFSTRKPAKGGQQQQQAPWGTHPILLSSKSPNGQYRLPYSGSHRGCCCSRCVNGKL